MYTIEYLPEVVEDMKALDGSQYKVVQMALKKLASNPECGKHLGNKHGLNLTGLRRVKISALGIRVVYRLIPGRETILVLTIGKREADEVYRKALNRYRKP